MESTDEFAMNFGFSGKGNSSASHGLLAPELVEQIEAGALGWENLSRNTGLQLWFITVTLQNEITRRLGLDAGGDWFHAHCGRCLWCSSKLFNFDLDFLVLPIFLWRFCFQLVFPCVGYATHRHPEWIGKRGAHTGSHRRPVSPRLSLRRGGRRTCSGKTIDSFNSTFLFHKEICPRGCD